MSKIGTGNIPATDAPCFICSLARSHEDKEFTPVEVMPRGSMKILREAPTSTLVRFKAGSIEPAHHRRFGHDLVVTKGSKRVLNLSEGEKYDLKGGDYFEDTEFFIKWYGHLDLFLEESVDAANAAIDQEKNQGQQTTTSLG